MVDTVEQICFVDVFAMLTLSSCKTTEPKPVYGAQNTAILETTLLLLMFGHWKESGIMFK